MEIQNRIGFHGLNNEIENLGHKAIVPSFPTPENQSFAAWKKVFYSEVEHIDNQTILVGHSLGASFILGLLDEPDAARVKAIFLLSGFLGTIGLPDYDRVNKSFVCRDFNWGLIKRNTENVFIISGENDPYVPAEKGTILAKHLSTPLLLVPNGKHLNTEAGFTSFTLLLDLIRPLL